MQIPTINISLQHYCYKSVGNACPYFTQRKIFVLVEAKPEVCVGSVGYQRQWRKFPVILLVKTYGIFRNVVIAYSCKLWWGWRKVFLDIKCHVILKTLALVILCSNEGGESALPSLGSSACRGDIFYCEKVWWRWFNTMILLLRLNFASFAIPNLYIQEKGFRKVKKWVKNAQLSCSIACSVLNQ